MVGNCALGSQIAGGMLPGHCEGYRALLGWLSEGIRREIMRGWREWWNSMYSFRSSASCENCIKFLGFCGDLYLAVN